MLRRHQSRDLDITWPRIMGGRVMGGRDGFGLRPKPEKLWST